MADKDATPATTSAAYNKMAPRWGYIDALLGGTETMREAGESLLPKHQEESDQSWQRRLAGATLLNMTELTLDMLAGKPFSDPVVLDEDDLPEGSPFDEWTDDVDLQGNNLDVFARRWFRDGMAMGLSHVLVDMPRKDDNGELKTLADDRASNIRPYLVHIPAQSVIFMSGTTVNGREVLDHVRISESELVRDGWAEKVVHRIRVMEPGLVQLWELKEGQKKEEWVMVDEWSTDLDYIPLVTFYTSREALGLAKPPLLDLAYMNVRHWQLDADLNNIISVACFPMLAMSGVDSNEAGGEGGLMRLGPNQILATRSENGKFYYVEHTGAAVETGEKKLRHLEEQMASYGAQFLKEKPGDLKATVRALDSAEALSQLQAMTLSFKDALETVLSMMGDWMGIPDGPSAEMDVDFGLSAPDETGWNAIEAARNRRDISREAFLKEAKRRGWLSDEYDAEEDKEKLEQEAEDLMNGASSLNLDPGAPPEPGDPNNPPKEPDDGQ